MKTYKKAVAANPAFKDSAVGILVEYILCDGKNVKDLSRAQKAALHTFVCKVLAAGFELYQVVEQEKVDRIIFGKLDEDVMPQIRQRLKAKK